MNSTGTETETSITTPTRSTAVSGDITQIEAALTLDRRSEIV